MIQNILFPVDFSPSCVAIADYIKRAAAIFGAKVTILHVCDLSSHNGFELYTRRGDEIAEDHWTIANNLLTFFLKEEFPEGTCTRLLLTGEAGSVIAKTAKKRKFDLITMPTHAGRFRQMLLGSTTARVLNEADCPVLTTQHAATGGPRSLEHRNWVCGIGLSSDSDRVLNYARNASLMAGAKLSVIHVVHASTVGSEGQRSSEEQAVHSRIAELQSAMGSDVSVRRTIGPVRETLLDEARQVGADVLVIGRSLHGTLGRLEDLTYSLVRDSPCPVVSI